MATSRADETSEAAEAFLGRGDDYTVPPGLDVSEVYEIMRLIGRDATTLHRIAETWCNVEMTERQERALTRKEEAAERRVTERAARLGCGVEFNGDPRGFAVYLKFPNGRTNDWGGRGWGL